MAVGQPGQPRAGAQGLRRPPAARRRQPRRRRRATGSASSAATATARPRCSKLLGGLEEPDEGRVSRNRGLHLGYLTQGDDLDPQATVRVAVLEGRADHEWAADPSTREVVEVLLAGVSLDRVVEGLSGGERRRCSLARLLLGDHDLMVLDEPTNHLDVEAVAWLARHLRRAVPSALVVVTHDRWFLDEVCTTTWEVHDGVVDVYDGGYAAFVLAKAERQRQAAGLGVPAAEPDAQGARLAAPRRRRRGPSKPKFRMDAAYALIEDEPPPRDRLELQRFATQRLGKDVIDIEDADLVRGERTLLSHATWRLGPGDRVGLVGVNGAGKTSVLRLVAGDARADARAGHARAARSRWSTSPRRWTTSTPSDAGARLGGGGAAGDPAGRRGEITASSMLERFGFTGDRLTARIGDLSGGERRRLPAAAAAALRAQRAAARRAHQRPRHRDADRARGLPRRLARDARGRLARPVLPGAGHRLDVGAARRRADLDAAARGGGVPRAPRPPPLQAPSMRAWGPARRRGAAPGPRRPAGELREARKAVARIDKQLARLAEREAELHAEMVEHASRLRAARRGRRTAARGEPAEKADLEEQWLEAADPPRLTR